MAELFQPSIDEMIQEAEREAEMRESVYPRWVAQGKLRKETADRRIETMHAIRRALERLKKMSEAL